MSEVWRPFRSGMYEASSLGRVRSAGYGVRVPGMPGRRTTIGHVLAFRVDGDGYKRLHLHGEGKRTYGVHQVMAEAFHGPCPTGKQINHIDGDKQNNTPSNLEYVTPQENREHQTRMGLNPKGERHGRAKLRVEDVVTIRGAWATRTHSQTGLAEQFGVSQSLVWAIINRKVWAHV